MKVRLICKEIIQPPFDTVASVKWTTIEIESEELSAALRLTNDPNNCSSFEVVGAELITTAAAEEVA